MGRSVAAIRLINGVVSASGKPTQSFYWMNHIALCEPWLPHAAQPNALKNKIFDNLFLRGRKQLG